MKLLTQTKLLKTLGLTKEEIKEVKTLPTWKYDCGKYCPSNKNKDIEITADKPVWYESRSDRHGGYIQLMCIDEKMLSDNQKDLFLSVLKVFINKVEV